MNNRKKVVKVQRVYTKGYGDSGASQTKRSLKGFLAQSSTPIEDIDFHNSTLRQRGRMLYMSSPIAASAIHTNGTKVVGPGLHMKCNINRAKLGLSDEAVKEWQRKTEEEWEMWASKKRNCDATGMNNFYEIQKLVLTSWLLSGDVFVLFKRFDPDRFSPYSLRLHVIEADRICTPTNGKSGITLRSANFLTTEGKNEDNGNKIHDGVEVDKDGRIVAYYICSQYPNETVSYNENLEWQRIEAYGEQTGMPNILHISESERPDQYRGVTYLAPIIENLLQSRRYTESELIAAIVQSYFTAFITTETDPTDYPFEETGAGEYEGMDASQPDSITENIDEYEMGPGTVNHLQPGESVTLGNPNIPTAGFESFTTTILKQISAGLRTPYEVLLKEFNASYSASKAALEEFWEYAKERRASFVDDFCQPTYEQWLAEAVARGRIKAPGFFTDPTIRAAWCGARWDGPAMTQLDPVKEATADKIAVEHGWKTNEQVTREHYGGDWRANVEVIRREKEMLSSLEPAVPQPQEPQPQDPKGDPNNE